MTSGSHGTAVSSHAVASDFNVFIEAIAQGHLVTRMFQHRARQVLRQPSENSAGSIGQWLIRQGIPHCPAESARS